MSTAFRTLDIVTIEQAAHRRVLKTAAAKVQFPLSTEEKQVIELMKSKLNDLGGVGLAAPQVNYGKQIIAIYIPEEASLLREHVKPYPMHIMINPSYKAASDAMQVDFEACYSVASKAGKVPRYQQIHLEYYDESGQFQQRTESGFYARVLQHEIDHINGLLIIDRLTPDCTQGSMEEMMVLRRAELPEDKKALFDQAMHRKMAKKKE